MIGLSEADLQRTVADYLRYQQNLGKLWFTRLNSGSAFVKRGDKYYKIKLCEVGTADFVVITRKTFQFSHTVRPVEDAETTAWFPHCKTVFIELKSAKGKQSAEQGAFQKMVEMQGCSYLLIRNFEKLEEALK